jgi:AAA family ATP:ADP antiporter
MTQHNHSISGNVARFADAKPHEMRAASLAFACNFVLMASYYLLRPVRDAMATVYGVEHLQYLYSGTLALTFVCSPIFAWLTEHFKLSRVLPGVFWFLIADLVGFIIWFHEGPTSRALAATYYLWFNVVNLLMISVFWSLIVDVFTPDQSARLLPVISAGGSLGAIAGPFLTSMLVKRASVPGMLILAVGGLAGVIALMHQVMREKRRLLDARVETQVSSLDHTLSGSAWDGFRALLTSAFQINQALFIWMMTWISTIGYFIQTDMIAKAFTDVASRTQALANIDLVVNSLSAAIALFGVGRFIARFGVTGSLLLSPFLMAISFILMALSPTLLMMQAMQALRRITQYAIARPSREICFTVVEQASRYKTKNVIDVVCYRLGDSSSAWVQTGLRAIGVGTGAVLGIGIAASGLWALTALRLGQQYERRREALAPADHVGA